jgi:hypothetical protein
MGFYEIKFQILSNFGRATGIYARMIGAMKCFRISMFFLLTMAFCATQVSAQQRRVQSEVLRKHELLRTQRLSRMSPFNARKFPRPAHADDYLLIDVTPGGVPIFKAPVNANAAITTGVVKLQSGILGLNLRGAGMIVGVWDAGEVDLHPELDTRLIFREPANLSQHATHVTGTILASGINPSAKGMAPFAKAITHYYNDDYLEMFDAATSATDAMIISNHSYGSITGWYLSGGWKWSGDTTISKNEDYRFGLYSHDAEAIDYIANLAPYYTMVWAAGNDRWEVGDGTYPRDGGNEGYDCIIPEAVAKNNIVIGAVHKVLNYTDASSVPMSWFSSFGPTDDGRIKPDLVADGVGVFSTITGGAYTVADGTSMATPNATGSFVLLQELYKKLHANKVMRSATLKALAIHSAREAGDADGPDYRFGWGLIDTEAAANVLLKEDGVNVRVEELILTNDGSYSLNLEPVPNKKITATIVWTDPMATSPGDLLDPQTPMLINDLDIRIIDGDGNEFFPWILDPANPPAPATKGDNFRDNVEKLEIDLPEDKTYQLVVTHKGSLVDPQNFSLILTHESKLTTSKTFYWIGGNGNWSDAAHWSLSTGGSSVNAIPTGDDRVIVDENSFSGATEETISLDADASCKAFTWLADKAGVMSMNGNRLTITSEMVLSSDYFKTIDGGSFEFSGEGKLSIQEGDITKDTVVFSSGSWVIEGMLDVARIDVIQASLKFPAAPVSIRQLIADEGSIIDFNKAEIKDIELCVLEHTELVSDEAELIVANNALLGWTAIDFAGKITVTDDGALSLFGNNILDSVVVDGTISLMGENQIGFLEGNPGATISMVEGGTQHIDAIDLEGTEAELVEIRSMTNSNAIIAYDKNEKLCFDYLKVVDIDISSESVFNAGEHSELLDSDDWRAAECDDVLHADFVVSNTCAHGLTVFRNTSSGPATSWLWNFGDQSSSSNTSNDVDGMHQYLDPGSYTVTLTVSNSEHSEVFAKQIQILPNDITNTIVQNGHVLASAQSADAYQWYLNDDPIDGATNRTFVFEDPGSYQLLTKHDDCNYFTEPFLILDAEEVVQETFNVYPNPASNRVMIQFHDSQPIHTLGIMNAMGQPVMARQEYGREEIELNIEGFTAGVYIVEVNGRKQKLVIKR